MTTSLAATSPLRIVDVGHRYGKNWGLRGISGGILLGLSAVFIALMALQLRRTAAKR